MTKHSMDERLLESGLARDWKATIVSQIGSVRVVLTGGSLFDPTDVTADRRRIELFMRKGGFDWILHCDGELGPRRGLRHRPDLVVAAAIHRMNSR